MLCLCYLWCIRTQNKKSMALGYVPTNFSKHETILDIEINGKIYKGHVTDRPLYDANGERMKS